MVSVFHGNYPLLQYRPFEFEFFIKLNIFCSRTVFFSVWCFRVESLTEPGANRVNLHSALNQFIVFLLYSPQAKWRSMTTSSSEDVDLPQVGLIYTPRFY